MTKEHEGYQDPVNETHNKNVLSPPTSLSITEEICAVIPF